MKHNKGAIELSANFIVVIIISLVIVVGGLTMFFKMKNNAQSYVSTVDAQMEDRIKSMMLSGSDRVAIYPVDITLGPTESKLVGVGITNIYDTQFPFKIEVINVRIYTKTASDGLSVTQSLPFKPNYYDITSDTVSIDPHDQKVKGVLIKVPKVNDGKGQYVYTINVSVDDGSGFKEYGIVQTFVNVK